MVRGAPAVARLRRGFTLFEVLVVLAIISVMLVLVQVTIPDRAAEAMKLEANRFVQALTDCRDTALVSGAPVGVRLSVGGYVTVEYRHAWRPLTGGTARQLPDDLRIVGDVDMRGARAEAIDQPDVICLPSGEAEMPSIRLTHRDERGYYEFRDDEDGEFVAEWVEPAA